MHHLIYCYRKWKKHESYNQEDIIKFLEGKHVYIFYIFYITT